MRKATFDSKGIAYASDLALKNSTDLIQLIKWNADNNIKVFRLTSDMFPWNSQYKLVDLPDYNQIVINLRTAGAMAMQSGQRITAHPDHFVKLGSVKPNVVNNSVHDLEHHSEVFDLMGLEASHYNCLNIHVGMNYDTDTVNRWLSAFDKLSDTCKKRIVVENDDKENAFSIKQLHNDITSVIGVPLTFDYFHHTFHADGMSSKDAAMLAASTWDCTPLFHYSESKNFNENVSGNPRAHADYVFNTIDDYGLNIDVDLEAKAKELAVLKYRELI